VKYILIALFLFGCSSVPYTKFEMGYKLNETNLKFGGEKAWSTDYRISCGVELGLEAPVLSGVLSYGVKHLSQCFVGKPFNNKKEYNVTYPFIGYKYVFSK